ncbi:MAG TPA: tetraacyldisaccharide 4'-kinase [Rhodospirillaceae bacterium]|nr:tetraacyldisaccharide 4'-kinase [Rhodospirillaceae bacterium]
MQAPDFWLKGGPLSVLLAPLGWLWAVGARHRATSCKPWKAPVPVVCVGNLVAGGAGKTPVACSVARLLPGAHFLSRGYGGSEKGPLLIDPHRHRARQVGDEPLLLSAFAPCWVAADRVAGVKAAVAAGASCIVMDDGFQDPSLHFDVALLIVDGHVGFGAGRCIPAGPLREPVEQGVRRATAAVILGDDRRKVAARLGTLPVLRARLEPEAEADVLKGQQVVAFAGIGRPEKFFHSLRSLGAELIETYDFPDHHLYHPSEVSELIELAEKHAAVLITTAKDKVRIPFHLQEQVAVLRITVTWDDEAALMMALAPALRGSAAR